MCEAMLLPASRAARPGAEPNPKSANEEVDAEIAEEPMPAVPKSLRHADVGRPVVKRGNMAEERGGGKAAAHATHPRHTRAKTEPNRLKPRRKHPNPHSAEHNRILRSASCAAHPARTRATLPECTRVPSQHPAGCAARRVPFASCLRPESQDQSRTRARRAEPHSRGINLNVSARKRKFAAEDSEPIAAGKPAGDLSA